MLEFQHSKFLTTSNSNIKLLSILFVSQLLEKSKLTQAYFTYNHIHKCKSWFSRLIKWNGYFVSKAKQSQACQILGASTL